MERRCSKVAFGQQADTAQLQAMVMFGRSLVLELSAEDCRDETFW